MVASLLEADIDELDIRVIGRVRYDMLWSEMAGIWIWV
jgi:hypothetical protein